MSQVVKARSKKPLASLENGERLSQPEFHRRYEQYPEDVKFELIGGVVYMASPVRSPHGEHLVELGAALSIYKAGTPGVVAADNVTAILGEESEPQPDLLLRLLPECGGQSKLNSEKYLVGAPELVAEIAYSSRSIDLNQKRIDYLAAGVQEYIVFCVEGQEMHWFHFPSKRRLKPDREGLWKSRVFPGLWIDGKALAACDTARLIAAAQRGLATPEHAAFVKQLEQRRSSAK